MKPAHKHTNNEYSQLKYSLFIYLPTLFTATYLLLALALKV